MSSRIKKRNPELERGDWRAGAACASVDPELFFPIGNTAQATRQSEEAKRVCQGCDIAAKCLQYALVNGEEYGIWGGTTEDERRQAKRRDTRLQREIALRSIR